MNSTRNKHEEDTGTFPACDWCHFVPDCCILIFVPSQQEKKTLHMLFFVYPPPVWQVREKYFDLGLCGTELQRERLGQYVKKKKQNSEFACCALPLASNRKYRDCMSWKRGVVFSLFLQQRLIYMRPLQLGAAFIPYFESFLDWFGQAISILLGNHVTNIFILVPFL
ncbi:hypothetical protein XENOCAPTIV_003753 [Xenoophorus captivus]|uniref:Uncharacterized protein n=1 Tax=Xenoophorus captivus TaxID=1517983 RepID=A0ABV0QG99_9TELE